MALNTAYAKLQFDPDDTPRMAAFSAFCWQHILEHATPRWIAQVREGSIRLQQRTRTTSSGKSCSVFHECVDDMVFAFVLSYAKLIWPVGDDGREHLNSVKQLGSYVKAIYATPDSLTITHLKEVEMRECNVPVTVETSTVESMIGCRVRSYLTQLLVSDHPVPASQSLGAPDLLQRFFDVSSSTSPTARHDSLLLSSSNDMAPKSPSATRKRRRISSVAAASPERRSTGYVRLRFTFSGSKRLQRILFCPSRPQAIIRKSERVYLDSKNSDIIRTVNGGLQPQQPASATGKYQCWLRSCGEVFQTTGGVVDHIQREHHASMKHAIPAMAQAIAVIHRSM